LDFVLQAQEFLEHADRWVGEVGVLVAVVNGANLNFAALDVLSDEFPQGWFGVAHLIGQAKTQI
jgi:hypothetical protein